MLSAPTKISAALERVRRDHPYPATGVIVQSARADADAGALWTRLAEAHGENLDGRLTALSPLQLRIVMYGAWARLADPACLTVLARLTTLRRPPNMGRLAWEAYLLCGFEEFRRSAAEYVDANPQRRAWPELLRARSPIEQLTRFVEASGQRLEAALGGSNIGLTERPLLQRALRRHMLSVERVSRTGAREGIFAIAAWLLQDLQDAERVEWYRQYLTETQPSTWPNPHPILSQIIERFGEPDANRPFWDGLSPHVMEAVRRWLVYGQLIDVFGGDARNERVVFWRRFLPHIRESFHSRDKEAVFIRFEGWFAVQFPEPGVATRMFENEHMRSLRWKTGAALRRRMLELPYLGRYTQMGHWQPQAQAKVQAVLSSRGTR